MQEYDYKGYKLVSNGLASRPRVDVYAVTVRQTLRDMGTFTSLDLAMKFVDRQINSGDDIKARHFA